MATLALGPKGLAHVAGQNAAANSSFLTRARAAAAANPLSGAALPAGSWIAATRAGSPRR
jgi:hypothetical protein